MKTLIILPGWGGNKETWKDFVDLACHDFDVHIIELPCFGGEPCPNEVWGVEEYADFASKKIAECRMQPSSRPRVEGNAELILLGHSFGGQVATYLVANNPDLIDKLILSGASVFRHKKSFKKLCFGIIAKMGKHIFSLPLLNKTNRLAQKILYRVLQSPDYLNTSGIQREILKKITMQDVSSELSKISIPTRVIWGQKDHYVPLKEGKKITQLIPDAQLEIIPDGTHGLHIKKTKEFYMTIKKFLS